MTEHDKQLLGEDSRLLTDVEIGKAAYKYNEMFKGGVFEYTRKRDADKAIAQAQLLASRERVEALFNKYLATCGLDSRDKALHWKRKVLEALGGKK